MLITVLLQAQAARNHSLLGISGFGVGEFIVLLIGLYLVYLAAKSVFKNNEKDFKHSDRDDSEASIPTPQREVEETSNNTYAIINKLKELQKLKEAGVLTDEEIEREKQKIMK